MTTLLLAILSGCTTCSRPAVLQDSGTMPAVDLSSHGQKHVYALYLSPMLTMATLKLSDTNLPSNQEIQNQLTVPLNPKRKRGTKLSLPFAVSDSARTTIGRDLKVNAGRELSYAPLGGGAYTWSLNKNQITIRAPGKTSAILTYKNPDLYTRYGLTASGTSPQAFIQRTHTIAGQTRAGLFLTSPTTITWPVKLGSEPRFESYITLPPAPDSDQKSDGLTVVLEIESGGTTTEVARKLVTTNEFVRWNIPLSRWADTDVSLRIRTETSGSPDYDYLFLSAPTVRSAPTGAVRRVIVVGMDTTRPDHFSVNGYPFSTTPELDAIARQSAIATHAWTPAPRTRPSFRSATTGRYPLLAVGATNIGEVFQRNGFATAGFVANIHLQPRFGFHRGFDEWLFDGRATASQQVDRALNFLTHNADRDTYLFLHFMDPHLLYRAPEPYWEKFVTDPDPDLPRSFTRTQVAKWKRSGALTPQREAHIRARYDGELAYMSHELGRLVDAVDTLPGETLIVFHSDHGEEFWEHGGFEHNHTLYDELTRAVLWVRPPGGTLHGPKLIEQPATLADIAPTLYDYCGFQDLPPTDGVSLRPFFEGQAPVPRDIGIAHLRFGLDRWAVVHDNHKYIVFTGSGKEELYNLAQGEVKDIHSQTDLGPFRRTLLAAHPQLDGGEGIHIELDSAASFVVQFKQPVRSVGVLDPGVLTRYRANRAWGEDPKAVAADVGSFTLSSDHMSAVFTPSQRPSGVLWVLPQGDLKLEDVSLHTNNIELPLQPHESGNRWIGATGEQITLAKHMVVVPPPGEAARMIELSPTSSARTDSETCRLCELGYMDGTACESCR